MQCLIYIYNNLNYSHPHDHTYNDKSIYNHYVTIYNNTGMKLNKLNMLIIHYMAHMYWILTLLTHLDARRQAHF